MAFCVIQGGGECHPNSGHGHVFPRPDSVKARCGGPSFCSDCRGDAETKARRERRFSGDDCA